MFNIGTRRTECDMVEASEVSNLGGKSARIKAPDDAEGVEKESISGKRVSLTVEGMGKPARFTRGHDRGQWWRIGERE